jgi:CheY-like chemotaxis protein
VYLPRLLGAQTEEAQRSAPVVARKTGTETILVVEDDPDVRTFSVEVLRDLGYRVLEAGNGPMALDLLQQQADPIDLLFSDVVLPGGMNGAVLASQARALRPQLKVLYTTGYARNAIVHDGRLDQGVELIAKPFTYDDLSSRVREVLDQQPHG